MKRKVAVAGAAVALTGGTVAVAQQCDAPAEPLPVTVDTAAELNDWMGSHSIVDLDGRVIQINDGTVLPPAGTTLRNGTLSRTIDREQVTWHHVAIHTDDVTLEDLTVIGIEAHDPKYGLMAIYDPKRESQHGVAVVGADDVTLTDLTISNVHGDGLYIDGGSRDLHATGLDIQTVGRTAISNVWSYGARIDDAYLFGAGLWLINTEPSTRTQEVVDYQATNLRSWLGGSRHPAWLWSDGPSGGTYNCRVQAVIDRPLGLSSSSTVRINPCTESLVVQ